MQGALRARPRAPRAAPVPRLRGGSSVSDRLDRRPHPGVESLHQIAPALPKQPGAGNGGISSDAPQTLLTAEALAFAAQVRQAQRILVKDKAYRSTPVGGEVGRFLRAFRWADKSQNTLDTYEIVLARLAHDFAHFDSVGQFTTEDVRDFLDEHWGEAAPATRRNRLSIVRSFFAWECDERGVGENPAAKIKAPKRKSVDRQAYTPDVIDALRDAQPALRDQIAIQLLGRLALRREELRLLRVEDFDPVRGTVRIHGKGGKVVVLPLGFKALKRDLEVHLVGRDAHEYLLHPRHDRMRPMNPATVHRWFKACLERAGLPGTIKLHELRHSAADNLWRQTGNLTMAQQLLRHESPATTADYLHPTREDLEAALEALDG
jgi:integrase/recombinase XerC